MRLLDHIVPPSALRWGRNPETLEWHQDRLGYMASRMADRYDGCFATDLQALMDAFAEVGADGHLTPPVPRMSLIGWRRRK